MEIIKGLSALRKEMKKSMLIMYPGIKPIILFFISSSILFAQSHTIGIRLYAEGLKQTDTVYITGNNFNLGNWNPSAVPLNYISDSLWSKDFVFLENEVLEFKFTLGNWQNEALNSDGKVPGNNILHVTKDTVLFFTVLSWSDGSPPLISGKITGEVEYYYDFQGREINSRDIIIWLPPSYRTDRSKRYPVLYMHDGQNIVDPKTASFEVDWQIDETADSLISKNEIDEIIIAGIYNTRNRTAEYSNTDSGYAYMNFIVNELKPFIDKNYRTKPDRNNTAVMGSSMGGLISFMLVWEHSNVFSKAACLSPAFHIDKLNYIPEVEKYSGPKKEIIIYIDNGGIGVEKRLQPGVDEMILLLKKAGFIEGEDLFIEMDKYGEHTEAAWARRVHIPLRLFFEKK